MAEPLGGCQVWQGLWLGGGLGYGSVSWGPNGGAMGGLTGASGSAVRTQRDGDHMNAKVWQLGPGLTIH